MNQILLLAGIVIILSVFLHKLSTKIGMPVLLAFLLLGMLFGVDGIFKIHFENFALSEALCSFGLIFIMFSGGLEHPGRKLVMWQRKPFFCQASGLF